MKLPELKHKIRKPKTKKEREEIALRELLRMQQKGSKK